MEALGYAGAALMGLTLGLLGGGGSILAVPILVYLFKMPGAAATYHSLFIVGVSAAVGMLPYVRRRLVDLRTGLLFFLPSVVGVVFARRLLLPALPDQVRVFGWLASKDVIILLAFGAVMVTAAWSMLRKGGVAPSVQAPRRPLWQTALIGLGVGALTGFVGAGGGFLIVPALVNGLALPMERAVGTSLLIIALNSLSGFAGDWLHHAPIDWPLIIRFTAVALCGIVAGTSLSRVIPGRSLKPAFGWFVLVLGTLVIVRQALALA